MAYDPVAESLRLIETRQLTPVTRLSRRRRHAALAVDVADDVAVTMFARRSVGCWMEEVHVFARHAAGWVLLGGGGGSLDEDALEHRPAELPWRGPELLGPDLGVDPRTARPDLGADPRTARPDGSGGILDSRARRFGLPVGRWINHATVRVNADVTRLLVDGRQIEVPWHGRCVVAWVGRRRTQEVSLASHDGSHLGKVRLHPSG